MVNDQLDQLYLDLELEGLSARLSIGDTQGNSSSEDEDILVKQRNFQMGHMTMVYEENAAFPSPVEVSS